MKELPSKIAAVCLYAATCLVKDPARNLSPVPSNLFWGAMFPKRIRYNNKEIHDFAIILI